MQPNDGALAVARSLILAAMENSAQSPVVTSFFDAATSSVSHVLHDPATRAAMIVDAVRNFDAPSGRTGSYSAQAVIAHVEAQNLSVHWIVETHIHADHLSAATWLQERLGGQTVIGRAVMDVQSIFADIFRFDPLATPSFDRLLNDGEAFMLGQITCVALHVPGHTPADIALVVGDHLLTGDTLFMPDCGTARADFPGGDARQLYRSTRRLLALPEATRLLHCHDYPPAPRVDVSWTSTVAQQRAANIHVRDGIGQDDFVAMRTARDATLATPTLMLASVQVNMQAGRLPAPATNGRRYLQLPLDAL